MSSDTVSPVSVSVAGAMPAPGAAVAAIADPATDATAAGASVETTADTGALPYANLRTDAPPVGRRGDSLRSRTIRGTIWTTGGYAVTQAVRLAANLVLTRLLSPSMFGVMSLVNTFVQGLQGFSDVGIGPAIVQNKRGDEPAFLNTAWTIQALRGVALTAVATSIAWPVAHLYNDRQLLWLMPAVGLTALIAGFNSTSLFSCNRHLEVAKLTILNIASQVVGGVTMIAWALVSPNVWALVAGNIAATGATLLLSHTLMGYARNRFHWDRGAAAEMMRFGRWIFVSTVLTFFALQGDRLIFGKLLSKWDFGVYGVAAMMASLPTMTLLRLGGTVVFPAYSRAKGAGKANGARGGAGSPGGAGGASGADGDELAASPEFQRVFDKVRLPLQAAGGLAAAGLIAGGPLIIQVLYDPRYHSAGWMLQLLAVCGWFQVLQVSNGSALLALGSPKSIAASNVVKLVTMVTCIPLGFWARGLEGAIVGMIIADVLKYAVTAAAARRKGLRMVAKDLLLSLLVGATAAAAMGLERLVHGRFRVGASLSPKASMRLTGMAELLIIGAVAAAVWVPVTVRSMRSRKAVA
jgi:O-antigen/teichoic acid export membrane protein